MITAMSANEPRGSAEDRLGSGKAHLQKQTSPASMHRRQLEFNRRILKAGLSSGFQILLAIAKLHDEADGEGLLLYAAHARMLIPVFALISLSIPG